MTEWSTEAGYMNHILYEMCMAQPHHSNALVVSGKIQLIGRSYSAAPDRGVQIKHFYDGVANAIVARGSNLDEMIGKAQRSGRISIGTVELAVEAHRLLNEIIVGFIVQRLGDQARRGIGHRDSFCSKYLHFHAPMAFPIYDSVVSKALRQRRINGSYAEPKRLRGLTGAYANFCRQLVTYAAENHRSDEWTPRSVDGELYKYDVINTLKSTCSS